MQKNQQLTMNRAAKREKNIGIGIEIRDGSGPGPTCGLGL
jgi:hypothetical protein